MDAPPGLAERAQGPQRRPEQYPLPIERPLPESGTLPAILTLSRLYSARFASAFIWRMLSSSRTFLPSSLTTEDASDAVEAQSLFFEIDGLIR